MQQHDGRAKSTEAGAGDALLRARRYNEAMERFEAGLTASAADLAARRGESAAGTAWASQEIQANHPEQAMTVLERAMKYVPDDPALLMSFGLEAVALGQFPIAEQALGAARALRPRDPDVTYAMARLEIEEQHMPDAERDLEAYLAERPGDASAYFGLGHVYAMEQREEEARTAFLHSVKLRPQQTESFYQLGQMDLQAHRDAAAAERFGQVLARAPKHAGALTGMGELSLRGKEYARAERLLAEAEASDPTYATPHYFRGLALAKLGRPAEAREEMLRGDSRPHAQGTAEADTSTSGAASGPH